MPTTPVVSTLSFPLSRAIATANANGGTFTLRANGTPSTEVADGLCTGTFTQTDSPAAAPAPNVPNLHNAALISTVVGITTLSNCNPSSSQQSATSYFDSNYNIIGYGAAGGAFRVYSVLNIPTAVKVGDVGVMGTETFYTGPGSAESQGHRDISFRIEADTADSVIVNKISQYYYSNSLDSMNQAVPGDVLQSTVQTRYRLTRLGSFTTISIDTQSLAVRSTYGTSTRNHYLWK